MNTRCWLLFTRSKHHRSNPRLQHHRAAQTASFHAAHPGGECPHGLCLPRYDHCKIAPAICGTAHRTVNIKHSVAPLSPTPTGCCTSFTHSSWCCAALRTGRRRRSTSAVSAGETSSSCLSNTWGTTACDCSVRSSSTVDLKCCLLSLDSPWY